METELFASVEAGDLDRFKELIKKETKETIDQVDFYGYTALHAAAENGRLEMIQPLLGQTNIYNISIWNNLPSQMPGLTLAAPLMMRPSLVCTTPWPRATWRWPDSSWRKAQT